MSPDSKSVLLEFLQHPITWLFGAGGAGTIIGTWSERRKKNAEAESTSVTSALAIVGDLREQLAEALRRLARVERQNTRLLSAMFKLRTDNFTLRNYITIMTRRAGDPVVPPLLMDDQEDSETWDMDDDIKEREA